jgi:hypothetical protein
MTHDHAAMSHLLPTLSLMRVFQMRIPEISVGYVDVSAVILGIESDANGRFLQFKDKERCGQKKSGVSRAIDRKVE